MTSMPTSPGQGGLPSTRAQLQELIGGMRVTQLIHVAATLGTADQRTEGSKRIDELASTAAVHPTALYRVLVHWPVKASLQRPGTVTSR
jgi:hypothetical protein